MYRVLIADDEPIERMFLCQKSQIVILDINMPGINGIEAAERIREYDKYCCIIFLTAMDDFIYAKKAIKVKALEYILKPSSEEEIADTMVEAFRMIDKQVSVDINNSSNRIENYETNIDKLDNIRISAIQEEIIKFIDEHYVEGITMQDVAEAMKYSNAYFCKLFRQGFDKNFTTFLSEYRVEKAKELLSDVTINVREISDKVGYHDSNYFTKVFKRVVGLTPSEYRLRVLENNLSNSLNIKVNSDEN